MQKSSGLCRVHLHACEQAESARQEDSSVTGHRLGNSLTCAGIKRFTLSSRPLPIAFRSSYAIHSQTTTQAAISVLWVHNGHHHGYVRTILSTLSKSSTTIQHRKRLYPYQTCGSEKNILCGHNVAISGYKWTRAGRGAGRGADAVSICEYPFGWGLSRQSIDSPPIDHLHGH